MTIRFSNRLRLAGLALGAALLARPAFAQDLVNPCQAASFEPDPGKTALARVTAGPPLRFGLDKEGCPGAGPACVGRRRIAPGSVVVVGERRGAWVCATVPGRTVGWLPQDRLQTAASAPPKGLADWRGRWRYDNGPDDVAGLTVTVVGRKLRVEGWSSYTYDAKNGGVNVGEIDLVGAPVGDRLKLGAPDDCHVTLLKLGPYLVVSDEDSGCAGQGAAFMGVYRRDLSKPKP